MKTEQNKDTHDLADTASSDFYNSQTYGARKARTTGVSCTLEGLEEKIARVRETLVSGQELIKRLESNQQLLNYVQQTQQELKVVRARTINQQNTVRNSFQQNFGSLQRQLECFRKNWREIKEQAEGEMEEEIVVFKERIKQDQGCLSKLFKNTASDIKNKTSLVMQELRQTKKHRGDSCSSLMSQIEQARSRFDSGAEAERKKRSEYEEIVLGLMDRTVEQGEKLLRRIC